MSTANETKAVKPFGFKDKLGYMFGDFGNDFTFMLSSMYLLKFYTDVMAVPYWIVGLLMMLARFVASIAPLYYKLTNTKPRFTPYSIEVLQSNCDISHLKATTELGYTTRTVNEMLFETIRWFLGNGKNSGRIKMPIPVRD